MLKRLFFLLLFVFAFALVGLALAYSYYDVKEIAGVVHGPDGHPIANAALTVGERSALSDQAGRFHISVSRGTYDLIGFADGFNSAAETVTAEDLLQKDFSTDLMLPLNEFTATVLASDRRQPIAGAVVSAGGALRVSTDARGEFLLRGVKNGTTFQVSAGGYRSGSFVYQAPFSHEITLTPALTRLTVSDEYTGLPLSGITATVGNQTAQTDSQGEAVFRSLADGAPVTAQAPGYDAASAEYKGEADLALTLRSHTLDGVAKDAATGKPLPHALISYDDQMLETDANGAYHLDPAPPQLSLTVKFPGYRLTTFEITRTAHFDLKLTPFQAKGIHIYYAMPRDAVLQLLDRLRGTEVNAVVLDVKEGAGDVVWPSQVPLAKQIGAYKPRGIPPDELIRICRERQLYCIARMVVFKDNRLGRARPDLALHYSDGSVLIAGNEIWMNPAKKEVWDYDLALAKELSGLGFDEVQFDYIRYPGSPTPLEFGTVESRLENIRQFLETAAQMFKPLPAFFSGDVFGLTLATEDEQGIGQRLEIDAPYLDYISPMMYPSTWHYAINLWGTGFGIKNCTNAYACPYDIIRYGTVTARKRINSDWTLIRPWLQAYRDTGFGSPQYILQKKGAEDADSAGWLFWNNQGIYDLTTLTP
jgi:hypothetical protein